MPQIDLEAFNKMTNNDAGLMAEIAVLFARFLPDIKARTLLAIESSDLVELQNATHQLRSRLSCLGAVQLNKTVVQLETAAQQSDRQQTRVMGKQVFDDVDEMMNELRALTNLALDIEV